MGNAMSWVYLADDREEVARASGAVGNARVAQQAGERRGQDLLELADLPYVGSGVLASAVGMDKEFARKLLRVAGLPVTDTVVLRGGGATLTAEQRARLGLPVFVKPARAG